MTRSDELDDDLLDVRLCRVASPAGMRERLAAISLDDQELDRRLLDVSLPFGLRWRLRRIAAGPQWTTRRLAAAAALLIVVGGWYAALLGSFVGLGSHRLPVLHASHPLRDPSSPDSRLGPAPVLIPPAPVVAREFFVGANDGVTATVAAYRRSIVAGRSQVAVPRRAATDRLFLAAAAGEASPIRVAVQGAPSPLRDLPDLQHPAPYAPRGVEAALNAEQRAFLLKHGVFPFVSPDVFPASSVPPSFDTASFEAARESLAAGTWPPAAQVRTEEFLAAADYGYARPADRAARLFVAGGVAPWNPGLAPDAAAPAAATRLLQVSVQARDLPAAKRRPTHLTVAVDVTSSMSGGSRLTLVRQALKSLIERLGTTDRFTLVELGAETSVLIEEGTRGEINQLLAAVDYLKPRGAGRLADGVLETCLAAGRSEWPTNVERRVVVISDAFGEFDPTGVRGVERFLETSAGRSLRLDLIDVGSDDVETPWAELARRRDGLVVRATTQDRVLSALRQSLTGQNQLVARLATLSVTFHPEAVAAYRLFGHEPTALAAAQPRRLEFDLSAAQTGTVLYEVQLRGGPASEIATVVLKWRDPTDGSEQEEIKTVTRGTLGIRFERAAPALQMATLAAATAGRLRGVPSADNVAPGELLQWAWRLQRTRSIRGLDPWLALLNDLNRLSSRKR